MDDTDAALATYRDSPLDNGDAVAFLDQELVVELESLADQWDPRLRDNLCAVLEGSGTTELVLAVARPDGVLLAQDHALWGDLRERCFALGIRVQPLIGLPSAERTRASA